MYYSAEIAVDHITDHLPFRSTRKQWTGEWRRARFFERKGAEKAIFSGNCLHRSVWEQDAGCSNHLTPTIQERPPFGAVFCGIKQCALALGFFLERCRRQRILHLAFSHIFLTGEGVDEAGTFFPKCFYCRWSQRPHFLKCFAN